jgi:hypothetical protein
MLQGLRNVPIEIPATGLPPIFTTVYEVIPNRIYDEVDTLTIELFTDADYVVIVTNSRVPGIVLIIFRERRLSSHR